jgi:hypothetical protein
MVRTGRGGDVIDYARLPTTPGARSPLAPPAGWSGDYREWLRGRYQQTSFIAEAALASHRYPITVTGPHAAEAAEALRKIRDRAGWRSKPYEIKQEDAA